MKIERGKDQPEVLVKWYDYTKWVLDRVDGFPKNQRFVLGTRLADVVVSSLTGENRGGVMLQQVGTNRWIGW